MHDPFSHHRKAAQGAHATTTQPTVQKKATVPVPVQDPEWNDVVARVVSMLFYYIWFVGPSSSLTPTASPQPTLPIWKKGRGALATPPSSPQPTEQQPSIDLFYATIQNARHFQKFLGNLITSLTLNPTVTMASLYYVCRFREVAMSRPRGVSAPSVKILDLHDHVHQVSFEYRLMCICLMLANKMWGEDGIAERKNDQWSEVSGIPIPELTTLESQILSPSRGFGFDLCLDRATYSTWLSRVYHEFVPAIFALPNAFPGSSSGGLHEVEIRSVIEHLAKIGAVQIPVGRDRLCNGSARRTSAAVAWEDAKKVIKRQWATCIKWNTREESEGFLAAAAIQTPVATPLLTSNAALVSTDSTLVLRTPVSSSPEEDDVRTIFDPASRCSSRASYKAWDSVQDTPQSSQLVACPKPLDRHKFSLVKTWSASTLYQAAEPEEMEWNCL